MRRRRPLSDDDKAIWKKVTDTVNPLRPIRTPLPSPVEEPVLETSHEDVAGPDQAGLRKTRTLKPTSSAKAKKSAPPAPPPLVPIDRKTQRAIDRGQMPVEATIDLHGLRQEAAHHRLHAFIQMERERGARLVLVITGKGDNRAFPSPDPFNERGILRRLVPQWLSLPEFRGQILSIEQALPRHGGAGAYYVRLRRSGRRGEGA